MMAVESPLVTSEIIEVSEFPHIARQYAIYAVPKIVVNERLELEGAQTEEVLARAVVEASRPADPDAGEA